MVTLGEDLVLLILMLTGLRRYPDVGLYGLWRFLYRQVCQSLLSALIELWSNRMFWTPTGSLLARSNHRRRDPHHCTYSPILSQGFFTQTMTLGVYHT